MVAVLGAAPHGLQEGSAYLGVDSGAEEQDVHALKQLVCEAHGVSFEVPAGVALALEELCQDALGQRVGTEDSYCCSG
jgi:hypothetical protein